MQKTMQLYGHAQHKLEKYPMMRKRLSESDVQNYALSHVELGRFWQVWPSLEHLCFAFVFLPQPCHATFSTTPPPFPPTVNLLLLLQLYYYTCLSLNVHLVHLPPRRDFYNYRNQKLLQLRLPSPVITVTHPATPASSPTISTPTTTTVLVYDLHPL